jgi:hypothetical protein
MTSACFLLNYVILHITDFECLVQFADLCAAVKVANSEENSVLQALTLQKINVRHIPQSGTGLMRAL